MNVKSNRIGDLIPHYSEQLKTVFSDEEIRFQLYWLLESITDIPSSQIAMHNDDRLSESQLLTLHFGVKDLLKNKPIQQIVGEVEFGDIQLHVDEHVLIPRPETEELVSLIQTNSFRPHSILDIGTGSGAIGVSLQKYFKSETTAFEVDKQALSVAITNATRNSTAVGFVKMDFLDKDSWSHIPRGYDMIVSNPPYVREQEKTMMHKNVLEFEPHLALFVSDDKPLVFYQAILEFAQLKMLLGGHIWLEINEYLANETANIFRDFYTHVEIVKDFRDKDRFIHIY